MENGKKQSALSIAIQAMETEGKRFRAFLDSLPMGREEVIAAYLEYNKQSIIRVKERLGK